MGTRNVRKTHNEQLKNQDVAAEYLSHAFATDDPAIILMAIRNVVDAQDGGISELADVTHLGRESLYKLLSPKGNPKLSTLTSLLHGLGLQLQVVPEEGRSTHAEN